ncbi:glycosyl transferase family 2 [Spirochaetia bacterium]|nr:glycosyl transferase family 2 [Spirochaetia bacterium]
MVTLSLVVPCFNEQESIPFFYKESCEILKNLEQKNIHSEIIFIDDGSKDNTAKIIEEISQNDDRVHYIVFSRNFGKEAAMLAGLQKATGLFVVTLDADLQHPPALIPEMLESVMSGEADCTGTRRVTRKGDPPIRSFFARMFYRIMGKLTDIEVVDGVGDFRLMNRSYVNAILSLPERSRFSKGIFPWVGFRTKWIEYENIQRAAGETKWSFWKLFLYSLDGIIAFSTKPLAIASVLGILLFLLSIGFIVFIVIRKSIWGDPVAGWASTACLILFCAGVQLFTTGILGAYLSKTYTEVKQRPYYVIRLEK